MLTRVILAVAAFAVSTAGASGATFTVNTAADLGDTNPGDGFCQTTSFTCSLKAAIQEANTTAALDTIAFNIPGAGVHTIQTATIPVVSNPLVIDGFTQPGSQPNTSTGGGLNAVLLIELTGGLSLRGGTITVRGVVANGGRLAFASGPAASPLNILEGCYVGTDPTGTIDRSSDIGVSFVLTGGPVRVGGTLPAQRNLISGNDWGLYFQCASNGGTCQPGSTIQGNLVGTNAAGTAPLPNAIGIWISSSGGVTIGGTTASERNVVSGNTDTGMIGTGANSGQPPILIHGNRIGVDATGTQAIPNLRGILFGASCSGHPSCIGAPTISIGGSPATANIIARNTGDGIYISGGIATITHNVISQNGADALHIEPLNPGLSAEIAENQITANGGDGINGIIGVGNFVTVRTNDITGNAGNGVVARGAQPLHATRLVGNSIRGNGLLGIDLGGDGVTPNDFLDQDTGPNDLMNFPVLTRACSSGGPVTVSGTMNTRPNFTATLEFFRNATCDPSGHGQGEMTLATQVVTTDPSGNASFSTILPGAAAGDFITATATSAAGETSEFSQCMPVAPVPPPAQAISGPSGVCAGSPFILRAVPGAESYQWFLNGTPIPGAIGTTYGRAAAAASDDGAYTVRGSACGLDVLSAPHTVSVVACSGFPLGLDVDRHAMTGTVSDLNGILEPAETVLVEPRYRNETAAAITMAGTATIGGPAGGAYALPDASADYGSVAPGQVTDCFGTTANCYRAAVSAPSGRPVRHWDATLEETTSAGDPPRQWPLHIGETFDDVPRTDGFYRFIEALVHNNVTAGCSATDYCPLARTTREQMAVFVLVAREGFGYTPPACGATPRFTDVPASSPFCRWIEELARRGVVAGCAANLYCPTIDVPRDQMTVFVLATREPPGYSPPPCIAGSEVFADVPASSPFCRWVEELARRGVVAGCGNGNFCPAAAVTRAEMSVFITATFGLLIYGP